MRCSLLVGPTPVRHLSVGAKPNLGVILSAITASDYGCLTPVRDRPQNRSMSKIHSITVVAIRRMPLGKWLRVAACMSGVGGMDI